MRILTWGEENGGKALNKNHGAQEHKHCTEKNALKWFKNKLYAAEHKIRKLKDNSLRVI